MTAQKQIDYNQTCWNMPLADLVNVADVLMIRLKKGVAQTHDGLKYNIAQHIIKCRTGGE